MLYNFSERTARGIAHAGKNAADALSEIPSLSQGIVEKLNRLIRKPGEYLFSGYSVDDKISVLIGNKEVWYKITARYIDQDTKELVYDATLVSDRAYFYGQVIHTSITVRHGNIKRKE